MNDWMSDVQFWHWLILAAILVGAEMLLPGVVFLWIGIAAAITGLVLLVLPDLSWPVQLIAFAVLAVVATYAGKMVVRATRRPSDEPTLNRRGEQYVGRRFTLAEPIVNGRGKIRIDDTTWKIEGEDLPAGTAIRVNGVAGAMLTVERAA